MPWTQRRGKYNARRTEYNGRKYDSKLEAALAAELEILRHAGEIREVHPQKTFELRVNGHIVTRHRVDFLCVMADGSQKVYEAKGLPTTDWQIKRELFLALYPEIPYEVVTANKTYRAKAKWRRQECQHAS